MAELVASRESDARVAVAMGWTHVEHWKQNDVVRGIEPGKPSVEPFLIVPKYTADRALVVPMMERISERVNGYVNLRYCSGQWEARVNCNTGCWGWRYWIADTANLAVASALLAVAEVVKGESDEAR